MPRPTLLSELVTFSKDEGSDYVHVSLVHTNDIGVEFAENVEPSVLEDDLNVAAAARGAATWDENDILTLINARGYTPLVVRNHRVAEQAAAKALLAQATDATLR